MSSELLSRNTHHEMSKKPFDTMFFVISTLIAVFGAIIGMRLITTLGISPNTSIIGVIFAMIIARIPLQIFLKFRNIHNQNLIQTTVSAATFGAANSLMIPIGIPWALGMPELVVPMLIGASVAMALDVFVLYRVFDSKLFAAHETWPAGVASAETIKAGDEGGSKAKVLGFGIVTGAIGAHFGVPMSAFGVAFIGNIWAVAMFGIGLLSRGYSESLFNIDLNDLYVPHGMMIGAGLVALGQFIFIMVGHRLKKSSKATASAAHGHHGAAAATPALTRSERDVKRAFSIGGLLFVLGATLVAAIGGLFAELSFGYLVLFVLFAAFASFMHQIIVGIAAMHSGWFPAFAVTLVVLLIGILMGFPPPGTCAALRLHRGHGTGVRRHGLRLQNGHPAAQRNAGRG